MAEVNEENAKQESKYCKDKQRVGEVMVPESLQLMRAQRETYAKNHAKERQMCADQFTIMLNATITIHHRNPRHGELLIKGLNNHI